MFQNTAHIIYNHLTHKYKEVNFRDPTPSAQISTLGWASSILPSCSIISFPFEIQMTELWNRYQREAIFKKNQEKRKDMEYGIILD